MTKTGATAVTATVNWATAAGSATAGTACTTGVDYISDSGTLTFGPLETTKTITVNVCGELVYEADQTFFVNLSGATHATVSDPQGLGTILNDDAPPTLAINDVTAAEGDSGTTTFTFTVTKTGDTELSASVNWATAAGSATPSADGTCDPGDDYLTASGSLTFAANDPSETITVTVCTDLVYELDDTFFVNLTGASGATISDPPGPGHDHQRRYSGDHHAVARGCRQRRRDKPYGHCDRAQRARRRRNRRGRPFQHRGFDERLGLMHDELGRPVQFHLYRSAAPRGGHHHCLRGHGQRWHQGCDGAAGPGHQGMESARNDARPGDGRWPDPQCGWQRQGRVRVQRQEHGQQD